MDYGDENDILFTNQFISKPELTDVTLHDEEFRTFYKREIEKSEQSSDKRSIKSGSILQQSLINDIDDENSLLNTNKFNKESNNINDIEGTRKRRIQKTYVNVDSRDSDRRLYPKPSYFKIFLGKTFYNVKSVKLASIEFPNTNAVINSNNNRIYWRNKEDIDIDIIDSITNTYPVYETDLHIGSYIATGLQTEMTDKLDLIKRRNKFGDYHYFIVELNIETDIVTFTSLTLTQLAVNPINVTAGLGLINVTVPSNIVSTISNGDIYYIVGSKTVAGIPSNSLNGPQVMTVINSTTIQYEINTKAGDTVQGGGSTVKLGKLAPFQLLWGEYDSTVAQNIGYPLENSSLRIDTYIKSMENLYQVKIVTSTPHGFSKNFTYINQICTMTNTGTTPNLDGIRVIVDIINSTSFTISSSTPLTIPSYSVGQITFNSNTFDIVSITNLEQQTILVTTFINHNYDFSDILKTITLYNTTTVPVLDGDNVIYGILSSTQFLLYGYLQSSSSTTTPGTIGNIARNKPITTSTLYIQSITIGNPTMITCTTNHNLKIGDTIKLVNVFTSPSIINSGGTYTVYSVPSLNTFTIDFTTISYDVTSINNGTAYISTGYITVSFPGHGFNKIVSIQNTSGYPTGTSSGNLLLVQTQLPNTFTTGNLVRIMEANCTPYIDDGYVIDTIIDTDEFTIPLAYPITTPATSGIIGFNQNFYIYGATSVGGLPSTAINKNQFVVRDIIDENSFGFYMTNGYPTSTETGGGNNVYISSLFHGFDGVQTNTKNSLLNRSINLEGENYAFLCCPQLATMRNTGKVTNIFARIILDQSPGMMVFNFLSNPKDFDEVPLNKLSELEFYILNWDGSYYEFNDLDYSFTLEITEIIDTNTAFNYSTRRGTINIESLS